MRKLLTTTLAIIMAVSLSYCSQENPGDVNQNNVKTEEKEQKEKSKPNYLVLENIDRISLLKLNIEGGEREIIESLPHSRVDRLIISCHDFRSERGDGAFYRTYDSVKTNLISYGYSISDISPSMVPSKEWAASLKYWIFATKK